MSALPPPPNRLFPSPKRKPYTPDKPKGAKAMTVAAGLVCNNGVILGADTEITYGVAGKKEESKLFQINSSLGCWLTYTGHCDFAKELVDRVRALDLSPFGEVGILPLIRAEYEGMLATQRKRRKDERTFAEFLVTARIPNTWSIHGATTHLYQLRGDHCFEVDKYAAIGTGEEFASTLFQKLHVPVNLTIEAAETAIYVISKTKEAVQYVDGHTQIVDIQCDIDSEGLDLGSEEIRAIEDSYDYLDKEYRAIIRAFPSPMTEENFDKTIEQFKRNLTSYRAEKKLRSLLSF